MLRNHRSRIVASACRRTPRCLQLEDLESRRMLSASGFQTNYVAIPAASSGISGYTPAQIRAAYGFNNVAFNSIAGDGRGQTIAIIDAYNDPNIASDLATFDQAMGTAAPPSLKVVNQNGGTALPSTDPNGTAGWGVRSSGDRRIRPWERRSADSERGRSHGSVEQMASFRWV